MKILYLGYNSFMQHKRGVENVIDFQSKALDFERIYYLYWGTKSTAHINNKFICISIKHCWYWPFILNSILFRLRKRNKFLTHSHNPIFSFFSVYKTDILTVHDGLYYLNKNKGSRYTFAFKIIEFLLYYKCSLVHFISEYTREQTLFGSRKNFVIIPNTSHFEPQVPSGEFNENSNIKNSVLIVRGVEERARFDLLLQVAEKLRDRDYVFTVAGKGPQLDFYKSKIREMGLANIVMLGYVEDAELLRLYARCSVVLMLAEYGEGFGLPIIEGYLFNKPVIASNRCAIPEVIISGEYLFENTVESVILKLDSIEHIKNENFREYYNLKYSNSMVLSRIRTMYSAVACPE